MSKQILGSLVGAVIGAGIMVAVEQAQNQEAAWAVLVIGILAGLGARIMGTGRSFLAGAVAAVLTIACFAGGKFGASYVATQSAAKPQIAAGQGTTGAETGDSADDSTGVAASDAADLAAFEEQLSAVGQTPIQNLDYSAKQSTMDIVWLVGGVALAYFLGRGSGRATPANEPTAPAETTEAPAQADDE